MGIASLSWPESSAPAIGVLVLGDSCIDAFPDESDDNELLFFKDDDAESKCLFFISEEAPAAAAIVDDASYSGIKNSTVYYSVPIAILPLPRTPCCPFP